MLGSSPDADGTSNARGKHVKVEGQSEERFAFGKNWLSFNQTVDAARIAGAQEDIARWLEPWAGVTGRSVLDVGSGSGLHSLAFHRLGAKSVTSFDYDPLSVRATAQLREREGAPSSWSVLEGSALDAAFIRRLGEFDLVYSWGVLHHTGDMWAALRNVLEGVTAGGMLWIALYTRGERYSEHLRTKKEFHRASWMRKQYLIQKRMLRDEFVSLLKNRGRSALRGRGMNARHDVADWLGGLPYEVASPDEILKFGYERKLRLLRIDPKPEGSCTSYLFERES